jgi:galactokinase
MASELERFMGAVRAERGGFFAHEAPITVARAPGWVDLVGGAAAAGGALALGWPLGSGTFVALQPSAEPALLIQAGGSAVESLALEVLNDSTGAPREYADAKARLADATWQQRLVGAVWLALAREEFARFHGGARVLLRPAAGPGASVGLVAAIAQACVSAYGLRLAPRELGLAVQAGLYQVMGDDPGVLGPFVAICAHTGSLLLVHQQPAWIWGELHLPPGTALWAVVLGEGPDAAAARTAQVAAALAYQMAAEALGFTAAEADGRWLGYLSNLGTARYEARVRERLPTAISGAEFLARYACPPGLLVEPATLYPVRAAAALAVEEHLRARMVAALLRAAASKAQRDEDLQLAGELLARSHGGQRAVGLGDPRADGLVELIAAEGVVHGLYGARATAVASGASLVVLGRSEADAALRSLAEGYGHTQRLAVTVYGGSSAGAGVAGTRML